MEYDYYRKFLSLTLTRRIHSLSLSLFLITNVLILSAFHNANDEERASRLAAAIRRLNIISIIDQFSVKP